MNVSLDKKLITNISSLQSMFNGKSIIISIDSSKSNTAIMVWSRTFKPLNLIELDGSNDKDILELIKLQRDFIKCLFNGSIIVQGGIEDIITKKEEESGGKFSEGLKHHHSRYVITAVYVSIIACFQDNHNITLEPIPNQAWKSAVLPKELNKRNIYKGSVDYVREKYPQYVVGLKPDDGTDAICIGEYMKLRKGISKENIIEDIPDEQELLINPCKYRLYPAETNFKKDISIKFQYNDSLSLDMNARAISNRLKKGQLGLARLSINDISIEELYELCTVTNNNKFEEKTTHLMLVVKRLEEIDI